jgi:hypothetical protein
VALHDFGKLRRLGLSCVFVLALSRGAIAQFPEAEIANSQIHAKLYLPDAQSGYYRATRFDWSGVIASLEWKGHNYFGKWFDRYDPKIHDAIMGPVEEFLTEGAGLGYAEAKPGGTFVKIGVGAIRKPEESSFHQFNTYEIADSGKWSTRRGNDWIEFTQQLGDTGGYAYVYRKKVRLEGNKLILEHRLKNTGSKTIASAAYEHNFFMLDGQPTGPDFVVRFPFELHAARPLSDLAETQGRELRFLKELQKGQTVFSELTGYGATAADYDIRVENRKTGAAVRQTGNRPVAKLVLWSISTNISPEAYVDLKIEPGREASWNIVYEFYALPSVGKD